MWQCYSAEGYPAPTDKIFTVERLSCILRDLEFDASHEAVHGMGRFYSEEECLEIAARYEAGMELCNKYLDGELSDEDLVQDLYDGGVLSRMDDPNNYFRTEGVVNRLCDRCGVFLHIPHSHHTCGSDIKERGEEDQEVPDPWKNVSELPEGIMDILDSVENVPWINK